MGLVKYNDLSISSIDDVSNIDGAMILIKTMTASSSDDLTFVNGSDDVVLDSTYPIYVFKFISLHMNTDDVAFQVNFRDGGSSYDATKTTTNFRAQHDEGDTLTQITYATDRDIAQGTGVQELFCEQHGNDADASANGEMFLFNPSSTTFVKHFLAKGNHMTQSSRTANSFMAGYCNVTAAIDGVQFSPSSGNFNGTIKLYGIKDS